MVVIQIKKSDTDTFLHETTCATTNDELIRELVWISNARVRIAQLAGAMRDLAQYGPMKPAAEQGIDELKESLENLTINKGEHYCADPSGMRNGNGCGPQLSETIDKVVTDAEKYVDKAQVSMKVALKREIIQEKLDNMRGAVMMAYPMGLPEWDTVKLTLEGEEGLVGTQAGTELLDPATAQLWVAGKEFLRNQTVGDRLGKNEKTKVVAKLQNPGQGAPAREPAVSEEEKKAMMAHYFKRQPMSEEEKKAMMAHYFKRQEELKRMAESNEDDYLNSSWADTKTLQRNLRGMNTVRAPGLR